MAEHIQANAIAGSLGCLWCPGGRAGKAPQAKQRQLPTCAQQLSLNGAWPLHARGTESMLQGLQAGRGAAAFPTASLAHSPAPRLPPRRTTAFTRMLCGARANAMQRVRLSMPPLLAL